MKVNILNSLIPSGGLLVFALMLANFLNFLFNAILGRELSLEQFSILTLVNTLWFLLAILFNSIASTANNRTAYLAAKRGEDVAFAFGSFFRNKSLLIGVFLVAFWVILTPIFLSVFHINNPFLFLSIAPAIIFGIFVSVYRGFFQGLFSFTKAAVIIISEAASKLIFALAFILIGLEEFAYLSIPLSVCATFIIALFLVLKVPKKTASYEYIYPKKLLGATFLTVFGSAAFLSIDLLLARHFLTESESGVYALLSLVGKMIFFLGSLLGVFILTTGSRDTGLSKSSALTFYKILFLNMLFILFGFIFLGVLGDRFIPILLGEKAHAILIFLEPYLVAISLFTIGNGFAIYHLSKQQFIFAYNGILIAGIAALGIFLFHSTIGDFINVILVSSFIYLAISMILHVFYKDVSSYVDEEDRREFAGLAKIRTMPLVNVSICVPAYNEEKNIGNLMQALLKQETNLININKIVIVSSNSTDKTDDIVRKYEQLFPEKILLVRQQTRKGKAAAINSFLRRISDEIVVVQSADTLPVKDTIELLCRPFLIDKSIGMTGGAPIPVNNPRTFLGYVIHTWWWFHRHIPRFGEIIAFRNIIGEVSPRTAVDEAYIQAKFAQFGYKMIHVEGARVYNKGSENISDIIKQRRRIFNGHTRLEEEEHVHISNVSKSGLKLLLFDYKMYGPSQFIWLMGGMMIELWAGVLGRYDKYFNKKNPVVWDIAESTKDLKHTEGGLTIAS